MPDVTVEVRRDHIERLVRPTKPLHAIFELIWNSLDADAKKVKVILRRNDLDGVESILVEDNGLGIQRSESEHEFGSLGGSWKSQTRVTRRHKRPLHGSNGEGRFRAFALGPKVTWTTVVDDVNGRIQYRIKANSTTPERFSIGDSLSSTDHTGTTVAVEGTSSSLVSLKSEKAQSRLAKEFARYLNKFRDVSLEYDGRAVTPGEVIARVNLIALASPDEADQNPPTLEIVEWKQDWPNEIFFCDPTGAALAEYKAGIHAPGFSFSAYITWHGFQGSEVVLAELGHARYGPILDMARVELRKYFKERARERRQRVVDQWRAEQVYPFSGNPTTPLEEVKRDLFDVVAVQAIPGIGSEPAAKKLSLRLIRESLEHSPTSLKKVLQDVLDLSNQELDDLAMLLDRASLASVISSAQTVADRLDFLRSLELLLFDADLKKEVLERSQLHRILAAEAWVFGEQYQLGVDDQSIKEVLKRHLEYLGRETLNIADVKLEDRKTAIVDLMLSKTIQDSEHQHHLIVELKRPSVIAGYKERQQIESYAMAVANDQRFRDAGTKWDFVLVANAVSDDVRRLSRKKGQPVGLIHDDDDLDLRIWVKHWGSIIEERRRALHFYQDKLQVDPTRDDAIEFLRRKYAQFLPGGIQGEEEAS
ncbi:ATP-binding protein [Streptomyces sp. NPDC005195]|uniref:ATP-binding protein n=1 Tax=Streptomyces sp. NPDC005195 TaxID=3154561 RepID=UPI0033B4DF5B